MTSTLRFYSFGASQSMHQNMIQHERVTRQGAEHIRYQARQSVAWILAPRVLQGQKVIVRRKSNNDLSDRKDNLFLCDN